MASVFAESRRHTAGGIRISRMILLLIWAALFISMAFARVSLVFAAKDREIEASQLQDRARQLEQRKRALEVEAQRHRRGDRLIRAAKQLGLRPPKPDEIDTITVSAALLTKYQEIDSRSRKGETAILPTEPPPLDIDDGVIWNAVDRMLDWREQVKRRLERALAREMTYAE